MHASSDRARDEALDYFESRFGVDRALLEGFVFYDRKDDVWAVSSLPPPGIESRRPPGLRVLRRTPDGLKPTSTVLILLNDRIVTSRVELDQSDLRSVLLGQRLKSAEGDEYVAICYDGAVVGCGRIRRGELQAMIPTGRRRELLIALEDRSKAQTPDL